MKADCEKEQIFVGSVRQVLQGVPQSYFGYDCIVEQYRKKLTVYDTVAQIKLRYKLDMELEQKRIETKRLLDARLTKEGLPCIGIFYDDCIKAAGDITEAMIAEIRFRNETWHHFRYDYIVSKLSSRGFYRGINADARAIFRRRFIVSDKGYIGALNMQYDIHADIRRCRDLAKQQYSDEDTNSDDDISEDDSPSD